MTANQINFAKLQEDIRHNLATEYEAVRHNTEDESIRYQTNAIQSRSVESQAQHYVRSDAINEEHYARMDDETARSHLAQEAETALHNRKVEAETHRTNVAHEKIEKTKAKAQTVQAQAAKTQAKAAKSQAATAAVNAQTNAINAESNRISAEASLRSAKAKEQEAKTAQYRAEKEATYNQIIGFVRQSEVEEVSRHNEAVEKETNRHNVQSEITNDIANGIKVMTSPSGSVIDQNYRAITAAERAKATESLARAGYLNTQEAWYAWNQIVDSSVSISQATKNFANTLVFGIGGGN